MQIKDFIYDGESLADKGYMICSFGTNDDTYNGNKLEFNKVKTLSGKKYELVNSSYDECITASFSICKNYCSSQDLTFSNTEIRAINRWLNRRTFEELIIVDENDDVNYHFEASFNVETHMIGGNIVGFDLSMETNRPFAYGDEITLSFSLDGTSGYSFEDVSDEIGFIYPNTTITLGEAGDIKITNSMEESRVCYINNCSAGEVITMEYPMIESSETHANLPSDFNWVFPRIANTYTDTTNIITANVPCDVVMVYAPILKLGV